MEAMALGLPVISTRHSGIPELVPADLLVTEHDPVSLAKKLVDLVAEADRWPELGRRSRATVEREFAADALDSELERILEAATRA
jgi:colanic acid/amylovoran biosynthesis glycosyltransferase